MGKIKDFGDFDPPLDTHPYYEIHDWSDHQTDTGSNWIKVHTACLVNQKTRMLSNSDFGVLVRIWLYRKMTGRRPPRDPSKLYRSTGQGHPKHIRGTLIRLELRGFLLPRRTSEEKEQRRGEISGRNTAPRKARYPAPPLPSGKGFPDPEPMSPEDVQKTIAKLLERPQEP